MPVDFTTPPRAFADPTESTQLTRRSWVLAVRDALSDLCEKVANKDQPGGYPGLDSNGRIWLADMPRTPLASARATANQTLSQTTWSQVNLGGEDVDDDNVHSTSSNTGRFTYSRPGIYRVAGMIAFATGGSTSSPNRQGRISKNGTALPNSIINGIYVTNGLNIIIPPQMVQISAGDYLQLDVASSLSTAQLAGASADYGSYMNSELIRAL